MDEIIKRDENRVTVLAGITDDAAQNIRMLRVDPATGRLKLSMSGIAVAATIDVGTTTTTAPGTDATATNVGTTSNAIIDFTIPAGSVIYSTVTIPDNAVGVNGDWAFSTAIASEVYYKSSGAWALVNSIRGATGANAYVYIAYASDASGTNFTNTFDPTLNYVAIKATTVAIASPVASDFTGLWKNYKGATGSAATIAVGTTTTGAALTNALVTNSGSSSAAVFDFTIPRGLAINWKGTYDAGTTYSINDAVAYLGTSYIWVNVTPASGHTPADDTYWDILAVKGTDGAGSGDVNGPAANTDSYIPQWNGANSKTLKDGLAVPAGGLAGLTVVGTKEDKFTPTTIQTSAYNASVNDIVLCNISAGSFAVTLPDAPADKSRINVSLTSVANGYSLEMKCSGSDTFNRVSGPTSAYMSINGEFAQLQYQSSTKVWYITNGANVNNFANNFPGVDAQTPITNANISINTTTRVLTITPPLGYFNILVDGGGKTTKFRKTGNVDFPAFTDTSGTWYFYFDSTGTAITTQTPWTTADFPSTVLVYRLLWNKELFKFTVTAATATMGDTYTNNSSTFTVLETISGGTTLICKRTTGTNNPQASGNLARTTGAGTNPIVFSAFSESVKAVAQYIEYHINDIPADTHQWMHLNGAIWGGGSGNFDAKYTTTAGTPNASGINTCVSLTTGTNIDDNLEYTVTNNTTGNPFTQDMGNITPASITFSNSGLFKIFTQDAGGLVSFLPATRFPFAWDVATNRPQTISVNGTRTLVPDNRWFVYFIYATQNPVVGEALKIVSAPAEFTSLANAQAYNWSDIQALYPSVIGYDNEIRVMYRCIFYNDNSGAGAFDPAVKYTALREVQDLRKTVVTNVATAGGSLPASSVTVVQSGSLGTNVQSSLENLDSLKAPVAAPTFTTSITASYLTASELIGANASSQIVSLPVATYPSLTELSYVKGVTSGIQAQINAKGVGDMTLAGVQSVTGAKTFDKDKILMKGTSTGVTTISTANTSATSYTATLPAKDGTVAMTSDIVSQVEDSIVDGHTTVAPSGNAVFDALALKAPIASPTFTGNVTLPAGGHPLNGYFNLSSPASDHTCTGTATNAFQSGATIAQMNLVMMGTSSKWIIVDSDAIATCKGLLGIALEAKNDTQAMLVALPGSFVRDDSWSWTVGDVLYAGETAGAIQNTIPTGADGVVKPIGQAITATVIFFNPSMHTSTVVA